MTCDITCTIPGCEATAVSEFTGRLSGERFAECAEHDTTTIFGAKIVVGTIVEVLHIGVVKHGPVLLIKGRTAKVEVRLADGTSQIITRNVDDLLLPS